MVNTPVPLSRHGHDAMTTDARMEVVLEAARPSGTVTFLFTDIEGSTQLWDAHPELMEQALVRHDAILRGAIDAHGGFVFATGGDGVAAAFQRAGEAIAAAVEAQRCLLAEEWPDSVTLRVRMALHTGEAQERGSDYFGPPLNRAARLMGAARGGQVVVSDVTAAVVAGRAGVELVDLGVQRLRGVAEPMRAFGVHADGLASWPDGVSARARPLEGARRGSNLPGEGEPQPFVGRHTELDTLREWWGDQTTRMLLLTGEAGVGKTRLATAFAREVERDGVPVLYGRAVEAEGSSYEPVLGALRHFIANDGELDRLAETTLGALSRLLPEVAESCPAAAGRAAAWGDVDRSWLLGAVADCLAEPPSSPVLLVLDDLQWADRPALMLLSRLLEPGKRARIVGAYRATAPVPAHLGAFLAELRRNDRPVRRISLGGLVDDDVVEFVAAIGGSELSAAGRSFAKQLHRRTAGNPFFVRETLRQLQESGTISVTDDVWVSGQRLEELGTSEGVKEVVAQRLATLSAPTLDTMRAAAVIGLDFELDVLAASIRRDDENVVSAVEEALAAGLVQEDPGLVDRFGFVHALVHEVLLAEMSQSRRARLEWSVGETIRGLRSGEPAAEVARHLAAGAAVGDATVAAEWCVRAAADAFDRLAYEEAVRYYEMAERVLVQKGPRADLDRVDVLIALGRAANRAGDGERWRTACMEAAQLARRSNDAPRLARAAISYLGTRGQGPIDDTLVNLIDEACDALRGSPDEDGQRLLAELLARCSGYLTNIRPDRSAELAVEALETARRADDSRSLALALIYSTQSYSLDRGDYFSRLQEAARLAEAAGDPELELVANSNLMAAALMWADREEFDRRLAEYARVAQSLGAPMPLLLSAIDHAGAAAMDGHYAEARTRLHDALRRSDRLGDPNLRRNVAAAMGPINRELGRLVSRLEAYRQDVSDGQHAWREAGLIRVLAEAGELDEAAMRLDAVLASPEVLLAGFLRRYSLVLLAEAAEMLGAAISGAELLSWLEDELPRGECVIIGPNAFFGSIRRYLGLLTLLLGRADEAVQHHEAALTVHANMRARGWEARSRYDLARALLARGGAHDARRAAALLDEAHAAATELGMPKLLEELAGLSSRRRRETRAVSETDATALPNHSDSIRIAAPPARVWELVTAMDRYGEWSSENTGGYWRKGADGVPGAGQIGDQFVGINRRDGEEWKAPVEIVEREEERAFAFVTGGREMNLVLWRYELQPDGDGTVLSEQWTMTNPAYFLERGGEDEVARRAAHARESMAATLQGMKTTAERS
jgi:class 3 adenylate cyclase/tetratricopeptide (TPR) repeat protein